jgi:hypothetical protein
MECGEAEEGEAGLYVFGPEAVSKWDIQRISIKIQPRFIHYVIWVLNTSCDVGLIC